MWNTFLLFFFTVASSQALATANKILQFDGYAFYDGERLKEQKEIKVGGLLEAKGDISSIDVLFRGVPLRLVSGKLSVEKSFVKSSKGQRDGLRVLTGKAFFYVDRKNHDGQLVIKTPLCNFYPKGVDATVPTIFVINVYQSQVDIYVHQGVIDVTIPKIKKLKLKISERQTWEYSSGPPPPPVPFSDDRKVKKMLPVFEALKKNISG
ncbi:MAG: hypothetical protein A2X86_14720 [Bdellovibrionales bacterium GWA2_49_15]|nr:MAG: hypothetical protein A2X86_14720 [Bdellovibrionales bacterium GWA2_49_15]HAZ13406.1 hypothetical protein [Bdellovibrionales bacterium]